MVSKKVPGYGTVEAVLKTIDSHIIIEKVDVFNDVAYKFWLLKDNRKCFVELDKATLCDLSDFSGSKTSERWLQLKGQLKRKLIFSINGILIHMPVSDIFLENYQDWDADNRKTMEVSFPSKEYDDIFRDGLIKIYDYLSIKKQSLVKLKLDNCPYEDDMSWIKSMIDYKHEQTRGRTSYSFIESISLNSRKHLKAASLLQIIDLESEITKGNYSNTVIIEVKKKIKYIQEIISKPIFLRVRPPEYICEYRKDNKTKQRNNFISSSTQYKDLNSMEYDVVLSFAGEDRHYAEELATLVKKDGFKVFYDDFEKDQLWGKNLYEYLSDVYSKKGKYCVMFLSEYYAKKQWPSHERKSAQERAFKENKEYILPIRIDDTEIPGILETTGYLDLRQDSIKEIYSILKSKLIKTDVS